MSDKRQVINKTELKWVNIKEVIDPEMGVKGFQFAERRGVDSIAFVGIDLERQEYILTKEYLPPVDMFLERAFGGSLDKDATPIEIAQMEIREEAGYDVTLDKIIYLGKVFVSSMMNQFCHLFIFIARDEDKCERTTDDPIELLATTATINAEDIMDIEDWKAITIVSKYKAKLELAMNFFT
jgi:8-oxo-dGTP pyrophosphatase MutT (NUDIX family)